MKLVLATVVFGAALVGCAVPIEVGTGGNVFKAIPPGSAVTISCGMLGEKFIWAAIRTQTLLPKNADVSIEIQRTDTGAIICHEAIDAVEMETNGSWRQYTGIRCFLDDPAALNGQTVTMTGGLQDTAGEKASAAVWFKVVAPAGNCGG
jgi:hypothetical protein